MTARALLVGTSFSAVPLFHALEKYDLTLSVCGNIKSDPCHQYVKESFDINYADRAALLTLTQEQSFDFIIPSCNDYAYLACAWVAEKLGLPGFDDFQTSALLHNKNLFRAFTLQKNLPVPRAHFIHADQSRPVNDLPLPVLVKPVDSFSGRGVSKVTHDKEYHSALESALAASNDATVVVEEFVDGDLYSHSCFISEGKIIYEVMADEYCTIYPYQVNCSNIPSKLDRQIQRNISKTLQEMITTLNLKDGLLHTQLIVSGNQFWIIECMRRAPGDLYGTMVELSTRVDYWDLYIRPFIDKPISHPNIECSEKYIARHTLSTSTPHFFQYFSTTLSEQALNLRTVSLKDSGHFLEAAPYDKAGIIFAEFPDKQTLFEVTPNLADKFEL
jgi:formate-dependent phosphoribosylglycinamide formyltransferase (GAR transformylase)